MHCLLDLPNGLYMIDWIIRLDSITMSGRPLLWCDLCGVCCATFWGLPNQDGEGRLLPKGLRAWEETFNIFLSSFRHIGAS